MTAPWFSLLVVGCMGCQFAATPARKNYQPQLHGEPSCSGVKGALGVDLGMTALGVASAASIQRSDDLGELLLYTSVAALAVPFAISAVVGVNRIAACGDEKGRWELYQKMQNDPVFREQVESRLARERQEADRVCREMIERWRAATEPTDKDRIYREEMSDECRQSITVDQK